MADLPRGPRGISCIPHGGNSDPVQESQESTDSDESLHNTLLIETMELEMSQEKVRPPVNMHTDSCMSLPRKTYSDIVKKSHQVMEVAGQCVVENTKDYVVEMPEGETEIERPASPRW